MRTIGLIGGMSWESTAYYYRVINQEVRTKLGGLHSAPILAYSLDFAPIAQYQKAGKWQQAGDVLANSACTLESAGAELLLICTNTMHIVADQVAKAVNIPLVHIASVTANALAAANINKVALLGTRFTMRETFYRERIESECGAAVLTPSEAQQDLIHEIIFDELCLGVSSAKSKHAVLHMIDHMQKRGAEAVIFGCTEIGLLISQQDLSIPVFDTTELHAKEAVRLCLQSQ